MTHITWIEPWPLDDGDTEKFIVTPNLYTDWRQQPLVTMFHSVSHKRRSDVRRYGPVYRVMITQGWVELEKK